MLDKNYSDLFHHLENIIPSERLFPDELNNLAYGTDASFYKLTPKIVVKVKSEEEVSNVIKLCKKFEIPLTFRASGTSLSGQSISDSVLLVADRSWNKFVISDDKSQITLQPSTLGGKANFELGKFNRKIGPDPASINAATVCGIAANNASGMTSGVKFNSYNTVLNMRIVFANGEILDTSNEEHRGNFIEENRDIVVELLTIAWDIDKSQILTDKINQKYKIKNTTGYGINSFVEFRDPIEIIKHLMIGSEGTLGFISEITLKTIVCYPKKATALIIFEDIKTACSAIPTLQHLPIDAAELMDRASLKSVENKNGLPVYLKTLSKDASALLVETSAEDDDTLSENIQKIISSLKSIKTVRPIEFTSDKKEYLRLWNVRKGLFPSVSKARPSGTTVVIEDVNFRTENLADAVNDLKTLFDKHGYAETIIWGHALSGNIHFVFSQDFNQEEEIDRYKSFMNDVVKLVIKKYDGSLKAEHGTGRNMAPFVKYEWGDEIYELMCRIKNAFDPQGILNPGVLINSDDQIHVKNLKPTYIVDEIIDKCIDCGFCENFCPSKNLTLTPRQRITVWREISNLTETNINSGKLKELEKKYKYFGEQTCATDGLCELSCPVDIDTGKLIKNFRRFEVTERKKSIARLIARKFSLVTSIIRFGLNANRFISIFIGNSTLEKISLKLREYSNNRVPVFIKTLPRANKYKPINKIITQSSKTVVYFPSCVSRTMGILPNSVYKIEQISVMEKLFNKAGYQIIYPKNLGSLCCGMPFSSKGFFDEADQKSEELTKNLLNSSNFGKIKIVFDTSPCVKTIKDYLVKVNENRLKIYDSIEFIHDYLIDELKIVPKKESITVHSTCSASKLDLTDKLIAISKKCSTKVFIPDELNCCGFAGDRGFTFPELNESALKNLDKYVKEHNCVNGYSSSKTCEIGLSNHSGITYQSIAYLVDECSTSINVKQS